MFEGAQRQSLDTVRLRLTRRKATVPNDSRLHMPQNRELVEHLYDAFAKGDVAAVLGAFDPAIEWREAEGYRYSDRNPYRGPQAIAEGVFQRLGTDVADFRIAVHNMIESGETVVVEGRYTATVKETGTALDAQFAHVWEVKNGRITRFQQYTDTDQWNVAMGSERPTSASRA